MLGLIGDRRGEAHLWLLLEETLAAVRGARPTAQAGIDTPASAPWEARRNFRYVAEALAAAGVVQPVLARVIAGELDDAFAVRGLADRASFVGRGLPVEALAPAVPVPGGAEVWLEAEIERHLELVGQFDEGGQRRGGARALGILAAPARAFVAAGALDPACPLLADLAASLAEAGFPLDGGATAARAGGLAVSGGRPRPGWVRYLRDVAVGAAAGDGAPGRTVELRQPLGDLGGRALTVTALVLGEDSLRVRVMVGRRAPDWPDHDDGLVWLGRSVDNHGRLRLGPPEPPVTGVTGALDFRLRPGLEATGHTLGIRLTRGARRVEATVEL